LSEMYSALNDYKERLLVTAIVTHLD